MSEFIILLEDLEISMYLGLHDFEKAAKQRVLVTVTIATKGFLDYDAVTEFIRTFNDERIETQEELVQTIHAFVMSKGATSARVYSRKPDIYPDCKSVGVTFAG